ncbi:MAG: hypothetical protein AAF593_03805 [Planctomycetota bacterium]
MKLRRSTKSSLITTSLNSLAGSSLLDRLEPRMLMSATVSSFSYLGEPGSGGRLDSISVNPLDSSRVLVGGDIFGIGYSSNGGNSWAGEDGGLTNYQIGDFTWDPKNVGTWSGNDRVWVGTLGGPALSTNGGASFNMSRSGMPDSGFANYGGAVEKILFDLGDAQKDRLLAFGGDHRELQSGIESYGDIWVSEDDGQTWTQAPSTPFDGQNIVDAEYYPDNSQLYVAVKGGGVWRTNNDTSLSTGSWAQRLGGGVLPLDITAIAVDQNDADGSTLWAVSQTEGVFYSTNWGFNWTQRSAGLPTANGSDQPRYKALEIASGSGNNATLYLGHTPDNSVTEGVYKSTDGGQTWSLVLTNSNLSDAITPNSKNVWWIEIDPNDSDTVYAGATNDAVKSTDGGATWSALFSDNVSGDLYEGRNFSGWVTTNIELNPTDPDQILTQALDGGKLLRTTDGGDTWTLRNKSTGDFSSNYLSGRDLAFFDTNKVFGIFGNQNSQASSLDVARSNDGGDSWTRLAKTGLPSGSTTIKYTTLVSARDNANELWLVGGGDVYYSSNANGSASSVTWSKLNLGGRTVEHIVADPNDPDGLFFATHDGLFYSSNGLAANLTDLSGTDGPVVSGSVDSVKIHAVEDTASGTSVVYWAAAITSTSQRGLWKYDSSLPVNSRWERLNSTRWIDSVATDPNRSSNVAYTTNKDDFGDELGATGVWFSDDGGANFSQINDGLPMLRTGPLVFSNDGSTLYVGTYGRGVYAATVTNASSTVLTQNFAGQSDFSYTVTNVNTKSGAIAAVEGSRFRISNTGAKDTGTTAYTQVTSSVIDITGLTASISIDMTSTGLLEESGSWNDFASAYYRLDGGSWVKFGNELGDQSGGTIAFATSGLTGSTLEVSILGKTTGTTESYFIDEIQVTLT